MLHANLNAVCSPQIASIGGGGGEGIQVSIVVYSGILEEPLGVYDNQVLWFECSLSTMCVGFVSYGYHLWHKTVLCGTKMSYAFLLIMDGAPSHMSNGQNH